MRFDTFVFGVFFAIFIAAYWSVRTTRLRNLLILAGSYLFYGWWDWRFLFLLGTSTAVDYVVAQRMERSESERVRKRLLLVSLAVNLGILGFFKYYDFFAYSLAETLEACGVSVSVPFLRLVLPVGISFYTFQTLGYSVDVYRRRIRASRDPVAFGCYVAFFPQLVAGPIERAEALLPQFAAPGRLSIERLRDGVTLIVFGLAKKVAVADNMAPMVDAVFRADAESVPGPIVVAGTLAFALQIYADFSGYTDIARGIAKLLGFELRVNFNKPYVSATPSEFWRRWHISLSSWLRDYLYIPLGGNRTGGAYRNLMITMVLGGLWHGAAWNFVIWGAYHGVLLCTYRVLRIAEILEDRPWIRSFVAIPLFFALTLYGWLLFRAENVDQISAFTVAMMTSFGGGDFALSIVVLVLYFALPVVAHHALSRGLGGEKWVPRHPLVWRLCIAVVACWTVIHARASEQAFIYFQF